jgi:hypothetical protein
LDQLDAKMQNLGRLLKAPIPPLLEQLQAGAGIGNAFDSRGSAILVVMPGEGEAAQPAVVLLLPVSDYQRVLERLRPDKPAEKIVEVRFREREGKPGPRLSVPMRPWVPGREALMGKRGAYAVFAEPRHRTALEKVLDAKGSIAAELAQWEPWLTENDAVAITTARGVKLFSGMARKQLDQCNKVAMSMTGEQAKRATAGFDVYGKILQAAEREVQVLTVAAQLGKEGEIRIRSQLRFTPGQAAAQWSARIQPATGNLLAGLPAEPVVVTSGVVLPADFMQAATEFSLDMMRQNSQLYGLTKEEVDKFAAVTLRSSRQLREAAMILGVGKPESGLYDNTTARFRVDDAARYLAEHEASIVEANKIIRGAKDTVLAPTEVQKIVVEGKPGLEVKTTMPRIKTPGMPDTAELMGKLIGHGGKMTTYLAVADQHTIIMANTSRERLLQGLRVIEQPASGIAAEPEVAKTLALLPSGAQLVACISPQGCVSLASRVIAFVVPVAVALPQIPPFPATQPIGLAAEVSAGQLQIELVVPAAVVEAVGNYAAAMRHKAQPAPQP